MSATARPVGQTRPLAFASSQLGPGEGRVRWDRIWLGGSSGTSHVNRASNTEEHSGDWLSTPKLASKMLCTLGQVT